MTEDRGLSRPVARVPLRAGAAHVMPLGAIGVEQGAAQFLQDGAERGEEPRRSRMPRPDRLDVCHLPVPAGPLGLVVWSRKSLKAFIGPILLRFSDKAADAVREAPENLALSRFPP